MKLVHLAFAGAAAGLFLASAAAQADMAIYASVNGGPVTEIASATGNTSISYSGSFATFNIVHLVALGQDSFGGSGELIDVSTVDVSSTGRGSLMLKFAEDNIANPMTSRFRTVFSSTNNNAQVTGKFVYDLTQVAPSIVTAQVVPDQTLGSTSTGNGIVDTIVSGQIDALTETINIMATGPGAILSSDDSVTAQVPAPAVFSLLGLGLAALGLSRRR